MGCSVSSFMGLVCVKAAAMMGGLRQSDTPFLTPPNSPPAFHLILAFSVHPFITHSMKLSE